jgi:hypothetical protein
MQVRMKCSCGREFAAEVFSASELEQCPDCGKDLPVDCVPAEASGAAGPQAQQAAPPAPQLQPPPLPWASRRVGPTDSPGEPAAPPAPMVPPVFRGAVVVGPSPPVGLAVASMVCGIVSLVGCPMCFGPFALVGVLLGTAGAMLGIISQIKRRGGTGMAVAGVITGIVGALLSLVMVTIMGFSMWGGSAAAPPMPPPTAGVAAGVPPTAGSATDYDPAAGQAPTVMSGEQVADALAGPLDLPKDPAQAERELDAALRLYPLRGQGEPKFHDEANMLYGCVQSFRRHLARAGLAKPADAEHAGMFRSACDELIDRVLEAYRQAGQFEQDGKWDQARKAYRDMMKHLPDAENPLARNALSHVAWCEWKKTAPEKDDAEPPTGQGGF